MILKCQRVSVFFIEPSSGSRFVPNKVAFSLYLFLKYVGSKYRLKVTLLGTNLPPDDGFIKKPKHVGVLIS